MIPFSQNTEQNASIGTFRSWKPSEENVSSRREVLPKSHYSWSLPDPSFLTFLHILPPEHCAPQRPINDWSNQMGSKGDQTWNSKTSNTNNLYPRFFNCLQFLSQKKKIIVSCELQETQGSFQGFPLASGWPSNQAAWHTGPSVIWPPFCFSSHAYITTLLSH